DQITIESIAAGFSPDLAVIEFDGQHCPTRIGFAPELSAGWRDLARGLNDCAILDSKINGTGRQCAAERIDAGYLICAEDEHAAGTAADDDAQRPGAALQRAVPGEHISMHINDGIAG